MPVDHFCAECLGDGNCAAGDVCLDHACCQPKCTGKTCGPDGCGGTCGSCASGATCSKTGKCSPCAVDADCGKNQICYTGQDTKTKCFTECDVFTGAGCSTGNACIQVVYDFGYHIFAQCQPVGASPGFGPCSTWTDCAAGAMCLNKGYCAPFCDATHPCTGGSKVCTPMTFEGVDQKYSLCEP